MDQNRRRFLRKVPDDLAFIQIERDEIGNVLNVSEGGLSFRSVTPVPRNLPVYFWFSFNLKDRIEAMGEVAWTDLSRTVGGLRFTQLSQASREQIKKWLSRRRTEQVAEPEEVEAPQQEEIPEEQEAFVPQLVAAGGPLPTRTNGLVLARQMRTSEPDQVKFGRTLAGQPDRVARFVSKARAFRPLMSFETGSTADLKAAPFATPPSLASEPLNGIEQRKSRSYRSMFSMDIAPAKAGAPPDSKFSSLSFRGLESLVELVPLQRYLSAKKRQLLCGVVLGACLSAAVTVPVLKFWNYRAHAETIKPTLTDSANLKNSDPTPPPVTAPVSKPSYPVAGIFSDPDPIPLRKATTASLPSRKGPSLPSRTAPKSFRQDPLKAVVAKIPKPPVTTVQPQSSGTTATNSTNKKSGMNPIQLWREVQAGNSKAAVELADLYIKGDGVPQNCQQARVLLLVASEKRNTTAIKRLQDLDKGAACP